LVNLKPQDITSEDLMKLQKRQIEWLYWLSLPTHEFSVCKVMGLSKRSISTRQNNIREKLGLHQNSSLKPIANTHKEWLKNNATMKGRK